MSAPNLALIGAGYWGKNLARNFHALGALHTLCDLNRATLESYGVDFAGVRKTAAFESVWTDPAIVRVAIAAPAVHHHALAKAALLAGKDVFVEKPLCLAPAEAEELIALAADRGRVLMVGHLLQYHPYVQHLQQLVERGELGQVHYLVSNRLNLGKIRREENALWSLAPHDLSVILSLSGNRLPEEVACTGGSYVTQGVADTALVALAFSDGLRAHVHVSWLHPFKEQKLTVVGSRGMAVFDDTRPWSEKLAFYRDHLGRDAQGNAVANKIAPQYISLPEAEPLRAECRHFLDCTDGRAKPRTDGAEGLRVLRVLQAAQASLEHGGKTTKMASA
jgi:UDP-2-acetamido-3-amino-2,3-dideoxy-glucuronate N-acetyltransferase